MKLVIFADSHRDVDTMIAVVKQEQPETVLHLGDCIADGHELHNYAEPINMHFIIGNTDPSDAGELETLFTFENKRVFATHGHTYNVEEGLAELYHQGVRVGAHIVLFGHTHKPHLSYVDGIWFMNPGRIGRKSSRIIHATYGVIRLDHHKISCEISEVDT